MKLTDYSIDDLHSMATGEHGDGSHAALLLHDVYSHLLNEYIDWMKALRECAE